MEIGNILFGNSRGQYHIDRDKYQDRFCSILHKAGYDNYGLEKGKEVSSLFIVRPYWWGDSDAEEANLPNFECEELGLQIKWYKYALRDSYSNIPFTDEVMEKLEDMVKNNIESENYEVHVGNGLKYTCKSFYPEDLSISSSPVNKVDDGIRFDCSICECHDKCYKDIDDFKKMDEDGFLSAISALMKNCRYLHLDKTGERS